MGEKAGSAIKNVCRGGFAAFFAFELVNFVGLLDFTVDFTWLGLLITSAFIVVALETCAEWLNRQKSPLHWSAWPLCLAIVGFDAFGDMVHFYGRWSWYDQIGHALGGFLGVMVMFAVVRALERANHWKHPDWVKGWLALCTTVTFGSLYEIEEYSEDVFNATNRLGDGRDTANDLLMNLTGGLLALAVFFLLRREHKNRKARK